jgi:hypothetical protein
MNSRIVNEFIEQANEWSYKEYDKKETGYTREQLYSQKLARLIVLDCVNLLVFHGFDDAVQYVRLHFGVKQ